MLCIKGQMLLETVGTDEARILEPTFKTWDKTIAKMASNFSKTLTTEQADIVLLICSWSEKTGHQKNSERRYLKQNAFLPPAGKSKPDWQLICMLAQKLGLDGFENADAIWQEMDIDTTWQSNIKVQEIPVEIIIRERKEQKPINNGRLLTQWHCMSRTKKSKTLNDMTQINEDIVSIHHITNTELFKDKVVELDKYSKQPCFKG
jgi:assimilatory nitrate reductase catalytic subunit